MINSIKQKEDIAVYKQDFIVEDPLPPVSRDNLTKIEEAFAAAAFSLPKKERIAQQLTKGNVFYPL